MCGRSMIIGCVVCVVNRSAARTMQPHTVTFDINKIVYGQAECALWLISTKHERNAAILQWEGVMFRWVMCAVRRHKMHSGYK